MSEDARDEIRNITAEDIATNAALVRRCFQTVADEMGITPENAPHYTAFITDEQLEEERAKGAVFFGYFVDGVKAGFVTLEKENGEWLMKRLAVLPAYRHRGFGAEMLAFAGRKVAALGGRKLTAGIIEENARLKKWYAAHGFYRTGTAKVPRLPFTVGFMEAQCCDFP